MATMVDQIFTPKYKYNFFVVFIGAIFIEILIGYMLIEFGAETTLVIGFIIIGLLILMIPYAYIKNIIFQADGFIIRKFILIEKHYPYSEITDIGYTRIKTRSGNLSLSGMQNGFELKSAFDEFVKAGRINKHQLEGQLVKDEEITRKAMTISLPIAIVLWSIAFIMFQPRESKSIMQMSLLIVFLLVYFIVHHVIKNRK